MRDTPALIKSTGCFEKDFPFFISRDRIDGYVELHQHDFVEIEYTVSGRGSERVNGLAHPLSAGNLTVLFPWDCHDLQADPGEALCFFKINMDIELFMVNTSPLYKLRKIPFGEVSRFSHVLFCDERYEEILSLFRRLEEEFDRESPYREMLFYVKVAEILMEFDLARSAPVSERQDEADSVWKVVSFIHQNYSRELDGPKTAATFRCSYERMNALLREHTGMDFDELVADTRIRNACARLLYHTVSIGQIARETGHTSEDAFSKIFKRMKGMSPANYRKKYQRTEQNLFSPEDIDARVIYFIHRHYAEDISLCDVAREFHYNENYLHQVIRAQTGQTFADLLKEIRVFHAAARLLTSDDPIVRIGLEAGFQSNETFLRVFRQHFGCSPSSLRKREKDKKEHGAI